MADINKRKVDSKAIEQGDWVGEKYGTPIPGWDDLCLRVRGYSSPTYRLARAVKQKAVRTEDHEQGEIKPQVSDRLFWELLDEVVLFEWENLSAGKKKLVHEKTLQRDLVLDPDNTEFRQAIDFAASVVDKKRKVVDEAIEKN